LKNGFSKKRVRKGFPELVHGEYYTTNVQPFWNRFVPFDKDLKLSMFALSISFENLEPFAIGVRNLNGEFLVGYEKTILGNELFTSFDGQKEFLNRFITNPEISFLLVWQSLLINADEQQKIPYLLSKEFVNFSGIVLRGNAQRVKSFSLFAKP